MTFDVAIVGGGLSGLACAVRSAMGGRRVVVLERSREALYPCNSRIATGVFHVAMQPLSLDPARLEDGARAALGEGARPDLLRALCRDARPAVAWLEDVAGARFIRGAAEPPYEFTLAPSSVGRMDGVWQGRGADLLLRGLEAALARHGGEIARGHAATKLVMREGRCAGVAGEGFEVAAGAVVIADGGYQADPARLAERISPAPARLVQRNARTGRGDGLRMALEAGAAFADRGGFYGHLQARRALEDDRLWPYPWADELARASLLVGADGRRIADEGQGGIFLANRVAALADPASAWVICDQPGWDGPGAERMVSANPHFERLGATVLCAETLDSLASQAGIDARNLAATVAGYNAALDAGMLDRLSPPRTTLRYKAWPIRRAPFRAVPVAPGITYTLGGIAVDAHLRALRADGAPIPGLYAVGSTTGGLEGGEHVGYAGGLTKAAVTGLRAASHLLGAVQ